MNARAAGAFYMPGLGDGVEEDAVLGAVQVAVAEVDQLIRRRPLRRHRGQEGLPAPNCLQPMEEEGKGMSTGMRAMLALSTSSSLNWLTFPGGEKCSTRNVWAPALSPSSSRGGRMEEPLCPRCSGACGRGAWPGCGRRGAWPW